MAKAEPPLKRLRFMSLDVINLSQEFTESDAYEVLCQAAESDVSTTIWGGVWCETVREDEDFEESEPEPWWVAGPDDDPLRFLMQLDEGTVDLLGTWGLISNPEFENLSVVEGDEMWFLAKTHEDEYFN